MSPVFLEDPSRTLPRGVPFREYFDRRESGPDDEQDDPDAPAPETLGTVIERWGEGAVPKNWGTIVAEIRQTPEGRALTEAVRQGKPGAAEELRDRLWTRDARLHPPLSPGEERALDPNTPGVPRQRNGFDAGIQLYLRRYIPNAAGLAMGSATATGLSLAFPPAAPILGPLGFLGGAYLGTVLGNAGQNAAFERMSPGSVAIMDAQEDEDIRRYPVQTLIGETAAGLQRPTLLFSKTANIGRAIGAGVGLAGEAYSQYRRGESNMPRLWLAPTLSAVTSGKTQPQETPFRTSVKQ